MPGHTAACDVPTAALDEALRRARAIDPTCSEEAVGRFLQEIDEAGECLRSTSAAGPPSAVAFTSSWTEARGE